jgi:hypothetical protein
MLLLFYIALTEVQYFLNTYYHTTFQDNILTTAAAVPTSEFVRPPY